MRRPGAVNPEEVNVDPVRLARAVDVLRRGIDEGALPGGVVCARRRGQMFLHQAVGTLDDTRPATTSTVYDLASLTKPMATAASILVLIEQGRLTLTARLPDLLGEATAHLADVTVIHLLTHTSGLPAWKALYPDAQTPEGAVAAILRLPTTPVGTKYAYSCLGFILLQRVVEVVSGQPLDVFARENVWEPLELIDTTYTPGASVRDRIAPTRSSEKTTEGEKASGLLVGVVHDGNARALGGVSGNAGLFGTAWEVALFGEAVRSGSAALFGAPTRARMVQTQIRPEVGAHTLLFFAQGNGLCPAGDLLSPRAVGHSGFTGTLLTIDPEYDLIVALLSNRVYTDPDGAKWLAVRRQFLNALAGALA